MLCGQIKDPSIKEDCISSFYRISYYADCSDHSFVNAHSEINLGKEGEISVGMAFPTNTTIQNITVKDEKGFCQKVNLTTAPSTWFWGDEYTLTASCTPKERFAGYYLTLNVSYTQNNKSAEESCTLERVSQKIWDYDESGSIIL
jgi:hypothetical protein